LGGEKDIVENDDSTAYRCEWKKNDDMVSHPMSKATLALILA